MKKILLKPAAIFIAGLFFAVSCSRDEVTPAEINNQFAEDENEAVFEAVLEKVDDQISKEIAKLEKYNYDVAATKSEPAEPCSAIIEVETPPDSKFPKTISLDYGTGCTDPDGNFRAGKIIVLITGPYWQKNTVRHSKLVDYIYNDLKIAGDRLQINKGTDENGYYIFEVNHSIKIWTIAGDFLVERDWDRVRTYNRGSDLTTTADDEVWVTGRTKVERNGKEFVKEITVPLYRPLTCQHFQSGVITTYIKKEYKSELNYGSVTEGECDNTASWTNGVITKTITLKTGINYFRMKQ